MIKYIKYRPDIDGLRAVSISSVVLFHINKNYLPGGFLGVDIFFVISGFLITTIIKKSVEEGSFSYADFYERRIRRIIPALYAMMAVTSIPALFLLLPEELEAFGKSLKYVSVSIGNIAFLNGVKDYFNADAETIPLLHTWSLAVEEQFYVVFPLILLGLSRLLKAGRYIMITVAATGVLSLSLCIWRGMDSPMDSFFLLPYRAWELLGGSLLALAGLKPPSKVSGSILSGLGLGMIGWSMFYIDGNNMPGIAALPSCLGAMLLIYGGQTRDTWTFNLLSWRPLVGLGLISYSVYLWHWPLIVFLRSRLNSLPGLELLLFPISLLLGWLSWAWIERPFRKPVPGKRRIVFGVWAATTCLLISQSAFIRKNHGFPDRLPEQVKYYLSFMERPAEFTIRTEDHYDLGKVPVFGNDHASPHIALWGDSHAEMLISGLDKLGENLGKSVKCYVLQGQPPISGVSIIRNETKESAQYNEYVFAEILADKQITTVVLSARWSCYILGKNEKLGEAPPLLYRQSFRSRKEITEYYLKQINYTINRLQENGKRVVIIYPFPEVGTNVPKFLAKSAVNGDSIPETLRITDYMSRNGAIIDAFNSLPSSPRLLKVKVYERFIQGEDVKIMSDEKPLYRDDDHLSQHGVEFIEDMLAPIFDEDISN